MKIVKEKFDLPFEAYAVYDCPIRNPFAARMENHADWLFTNKSDRDAGSLWITAWTWNADGSLEEHVIDERDGVDRDNPMFRKNVFEMAKYIQHELENRLRGKVSLGGRPVDYDEVVFHMDDGIREELHAEMAPCGDQEFLVAYMQRHEAKFGEAYDV